MSIYNNTTLLNSLLEQVNNLPDAGGVELPELTNPANQTEIFSGKQVIDEEGNVVTGSFTIDDELNTQIDLINQARTALQSKGSGSINTCTVTIDSAIFLMRLGVTTFNQGNFDTFYVMNSHNANQKFFIIENVVCGSTIYLQLMNPGQIDTTLAYIASDSGFSSHGFLFRAPLEKNANSIIQIYDIGGN